MAEVTLVAIKRRPIRRLTRLEIELPSRGGAVLRVSYETTAGAAETEAEAFCDVTQALERLAQIVTPRAAPPAPAAPEEEEEA